MLVALSVVTRSMHNCRVFSYCGGVQKLTALMKGRIIQTLCHAELLGMFLSSCYRLCWMSVLITFFKFFSWKTIIWGTMIVVQLC